MRSRSNRFRQKIYHIVCVLILFVVSYAKANTAIEGFTIDINRGSFDVINTKDHQVWLKDVSAAFVCNNKNYSTRDMVSLGTTITSVNTSFGHGNTLTWRFSNTHDHLGFALELTSYDDPEWNTVNGWVENNSNKKITLNSVRLLEVKDGPAIGGNFERWRALFNSTDSLTWVGDKLKKENQQISSRLIMALWSKDSNVQAVIGFSIKHAWGDVVLKRTAKGVMLIANSNLDVDIAPGKKMYAEAVHMALGPVSSTMPYLIEKTGREVGARVNAPSFGGWCSWYGFNPFIDNDVTEDAVTNFAKSAKEYRNELPLQVMLLDDGYCTLPGDWTDLRPVFPHGMPYLVNKVSQNGLMPGIWIAPSLVHQNSKLIIKHPGWVERNKKGTPRDSLYNWGGITHSLDVSNPGVLRHIDSLFKIVCGKWGYKYLKLDFNMEPGEIRYDRSITSFEAMKNMYKVIQKAAGNSVFIANCAGSPYPPAIGIAQAGRVGPDVNPNWESVIHGCRSSILHIPFHRRWWVNDPDCLNMRVIGSQLTETELEVAITANYMGGGYIMFSDSLEKLPVERRRLLAQALPPYGKAARILDYMTAPDPGIPRILNLPIEHKNELAYVMTAVFNWADMPADAELKFDKLGLDTTLEYYVYDFWTDSYKGKFKDGYYIKGELPHSCQLLAIRPVVNGQIQIISTNLHLLQGTLEITGISYRNTSPFDNAKAEICIKIKPVSLRDGKIILAGGDGLRIAAFQGGNGNLKKRSDGLWDLYVNNLQNEAAIVLRDR